MPTVTVVTRTKDRPLLLDRAVRSVMAQTMEDLQMVVVNDGGSPREVDDVLRALESECRGRVSVIHHEHSKGMEAASNAGLRATESRYVAILDDDDSWDPSFLEQTISMAESLRSMGVVTQTTVVHETVEDGEIRFLQSFPFDPTPGSWMIPRPPNNLFRLVSWNQFPPCAFLYRRTVLDDIGYYDETLPVLGDWDFNLRFIAKFRIEYLPAPLAFYHHRPNDLSSNSVHVGEDLHEQVRLELLDRYLRRDLERNELGVGFAANLLYDMRQTSNELARRLEDLDRRLSDIDDTIQATKESIGHLLRRNTEASVAESPISESPFGADTTRAGGTLFRLDPRNRAGRKSKAGPRDQP